MSGAATILALSFANFAYQYFQVEPNYSVALDRSFFQAIAILAYSFEKFLNGK